MRGVDELPGAAPGRDLVQVHARVIQKKPQNMRASLMSATKAPAYAVIARVKVSSM